MNHPVTHVTLVILKSQKTSTSKVRHRRKHSVDFNTDILHGDVTQNAAPSIGNANTLSTPDAAGSPRTVEVQDTAQNQQTTRENFAATRIQTAFRGFLVLNFFISSLICS